MGCGARRIGPAQRLHVRHGQRRRHSPSRPPGGVCRPRRCHPAQSGGPHVGERFDFLPCARRHHRKGCLPDGQRFGLRQRGHGPRHVQRENLHHEQQPLPAEQRSRRRMSGRGRRRDVPPRKGLHGRRPHLPPARRFARGAGDAPAVDPAGEHRRHGRAQHLLLGQPGSVPARRHNRRAEHRQGLLCLRQPGCHHRDGGLDARHDRHRRPPLLRRRGLLVRDQALRVHPGQRRGDA